MNTHTVVFSSVDGASLLFLARVQQDTARFPGVRGWVPPSGERP